MRNAWIIAAGIMAAGSAQAADSYVARIKIVGTDGKFQMYDLKTGPQEKSGERVSYDECILRRDIWMKEHGPAFETAIATLAAQGKQSSFKVTCDRVDG